MKKDDIKYCIVTEGADFNFPYLRVMLNSLLAHDNWVKDNIVIMTCDLTPLSSHNREILKSISNKIQFIDIDAKLFSNITVKNQDRNQVLLSLYRLNCFNLKTFDVALYISSYSLCVSSITSLFEGHSDISLADTGIMAQSTRNPNQKMLSSELNSSVMLMSSSIMSNETFKKSLLNIDKIKRLSNRSIDQIIQNSLNLEKIDYSLFSLNLITKKSKFPDSKFRNYQAVQGKVCIINMDIELSKTSNVHFMFKRINSIWKGYNQQRGLNIENVNSQTLNEYVKLRLKKTEKPDLDMKNFTKNMNFHEIRKLKETNARLDKVHGININKAKSIASDNSLANMTNYEAYTIYEKESDITVLDSEVDTKFKGEIVLSVVIPYFRAGYIGWVPFESLIRQENIDFKWEIVIIEENFENPFGLDRILEYKDELAKVGCSRIKYISIKKWLPLSAKWYFLVDACSASSKIVAMNSSDIYCSKLRLSKQYSKLINGDKNWYKIGGNLVYDIGLDYHVKLISMDPKRSDTCSAAASMELMKKLPLACVKVNVDGWRYNTLKNVGIDFFYDNTADLQKDTININGLNNLSLGRAKNVKNIKPPFKKCCDDLCNHIPIEISQKLIESNKYIAEHKKNRSDSKIKLR